MVGTAGRIGESDQLLFDPHIPPQPGFVPGRAMERPFREQVELEPVGERVIADDVPALRVCQVGEPMTFQIRPRVDFRGLEDGLDGLGWLAPQESNSKGIADSHGAAPRTAPTPSRYPNGVPNCKSAVVDAD